MNDKKYASFEFRVGMRGSGKDEVGRVKGGRSPAKRTLDADNLPTTLKGLG